MALHWNLSTIKNCDTVCFKTDDDGKRSLLGRTEGLIWATMIVGMNGITEKNAAKFFARLSLYERLNGALRTQWVDGEDTVRNIYYTEEDIRLHIGLGTNATNDTDAAWLKRITARFIKDAESQYSRNLRRVEAEASEPDLSSIPVCDGCGNRSESVEDAGGRVDEGADGLAFCATCRK